eukprot:7567223-Pyramimonas_sp.AAC.1
MVSAVEAAATRRTAQATGARGGCLEPVDNAELRGGFRLGLCERKLQAGTVARCKWRLHSARNHAGGTRTLRRRARRESAGRPRARAELFRAGSPGGAAPGAPVSAWSCKPHSEPLSLSR